MEMVQIRYSDMRTLAILATAIQFCNVYIIYPNSEMICYDTHWDNQKAANPGN